MLHGRVRDSMQCRCRLLKPDDDIADQGCSCFLPRCHIVRHFGLSRIGLEILSSSYLNKKNLTLIMYLRYLGNDLSKRVTNAVIAFP